MKFVLIIGSGAVGKMTVGQELMKITDLRLFHNHMTIEPVIPLILELRESIFRRFAASGQYGMIFTYMWAFDIQSDWDYIEHVKSIFAPYDTEFYCVELVAPQEIRLERNKTENRLKNKASKRDTAISEMRLKMEDDACRLVSNPSEVPFENYLRIDNSSMSAADAAQLIKNTFHL